MTSTVVLQGAGASESAAFLVASLVTGFVTREAKLIVDCPTSGPALARAPPVDRFELDMLGLRSQWRVARGSSEGLFVGCSLMDGNAMVT